ncbi:MAG: hypothetical protein RL642_270 [Bacteroidota bacterium]|jgi:hypothetical protein
MTTEQEVYEKKIIQFEKKYGANDFSDMIRYTHDRFLASDKRHDEIMKEFDKNMVLFSEQSLIEFKKLWAKLKEIEQRIPGPVVPKPVDPKPVDPPKPDKSDDKPKISSKSK